MQVGSLRTLEMRPSQIHLLTLLHLSSQILFRRPLKVWENPDWEKCRPQEEVNQLLSTELRNPAFTFLFVCSEVWVTQTEVVCEWFCEFALARSSYNVFYALVLSCVFSSCASVLPRQRWVFAHLHCQRRWDSKMFLPRAPSASPEPLNVWR